ncbi:hypothetical protein OAF54_01050 [bacterium]|nr:hypothetical protein [bacterium]
MSKKPDLIHFRIRPGGRHGKYYFVVYVSPTCAGMMEIYNANEGAELDEGDHACLQVYEKRGDACLGALYFARERLSYGLVSHEMLHGAAWYAKKTHAAIKWDSEEAMCRCIETLVNQFHHHYNAGVDMFD